MGTELKKTMRALKNCWMVGLTASLLFSMPACFGESKTKPSPQKAASDNIPALAEARKLTDTAYELKLTGHNGRAMRVFDKVHALLVEATGPRSKQVASNMDDRATIHMRTGNYNGAKRLYRDALAILEMTSPKDERLIAGIKSRLLTLSELERRNIVCSEPLEPPTTDRAKDAGADGGTVTPPYFPVVKEMHRGFGKLNARLKGCVKGASAPATMHLVVTGQGQIVEARARGPFAETETGTCLEKKIISIAPEFTDQLPRFSACFRNFTYPFVVGE